MMMRAFNKRLGILALAAAAILMFVGCAKTEATVEQNKVSGKSDTEDAVQKLKLSLFLHPCTKRWLKVFRL